MKVVFLAFAILALGAALQAGSAQSISVIFALRPKGHLGGGAALSHDATKIAYVGPPVPLGALHVVDIASRTDRVLTREGVACDPSFSPDGKRIVFSLSGGTWHYPSDIYSVRLDGTGLTQLTHSKPAELNDKGEYATEFAGDYAEYFYTPKYSPDGSEILVWRDPGTTRTNPTELAITISPDGSGIRVLTEGKPLGWAEMGKAIFIQTDQCAFCKYELGSRTIKPIRGFDEMDVLGKLRGKDTFAVDNHGWLTLVTVTDLAAGSSRILPLPTRMTPGAEDVGALPANVLPRGLELTEVTSDGSGSYLLLYYTSDFEVLQVVKIN